MDAITFKQKYMSYHPKLYRIAYRLLGDTEDAEDVVQEAYIKLWNKRNELKHVDNSESYSVILLRNLCLDFLRTKNKQRLESMNEIRNDISDQSVLLSEIEYNDEIKHVEHIIGQLPEQQKIIMQLKHFDDYSNEEIEQITGLSNSNVRVLLSRARKKVRELFEKQYRYEK
jgi:RNA polymerase sigma-70 factor (ECF subfamily)